MFMEQDDLELSFILLFYLHAKVINLNRNFKLEHLEQLYIASKKLYHSQSVKMTICDNFFQKAFFHFGVTSGKCFGEKKKK